MRTIRLREGPQPDDSSLVVRGGGLEDRDDEHLRRRARSARAAIGLLAQSVLVAREEELAEVCRTDPRLARYLRVNLSTVGRIRRAGFPMEPTGDAPHYSVVFPDLQPDTIGRFRACFDAAQPNPPTTLPR